MQVLLLLANAHVDLFPPVECAIVEEREKFFELLDNSIFVRDRSNEFVIILDFHHERGQFQIKQKNVFFVLDCS